MKLNEYTPNLVKHEISVGLHVSWKKIHKYSIVLHFLFSFESATLLNVNS